MPKLAKWVVFAVVVAVALSPLCEIFDKTDEWSDDGSDFAFYMICLFGFLAFSLRHGSLVLIERIISIRNGGLLTILPSSAAPNVEQVCSEQNELFLTFCDLRI